MRAGDRCRRPTGASVAVAGPPTSCSVNSEPRPIARSARRPSCRRATRARCRRRRARRAGPASPSRSGHAVGAAHDAGDPHLRAPAGDDERRHAGAVARDRHRGDLRRARPGVGDGELLPVRPRTPTSAAGCVARDAPDVRRTGRALGSTSPARVSITATPPSAGTRATAPSTSRTRREVAVGRDLDRGRATRCSSPRRGRGRASARRRRGSRSPPRSSTSGGPGDARRARRDRLGVERGRRRPTSAHRTTPAVREARRRAGSACGRASSDSHERAPSRSRSTCATPDFDRHRRARERHALGERVDAPSRRATRSATPLTSASAIARRGVRRREPAHVGHEELPRRVEVHERVAVEHVREDVAIEHDPVGGLGDPPLAVVLLRELERAAAVDARLGRLVRAGLVDGRDRDERQHDRALRRARVDAVVRQVDRDARLGLPRLADRGREEHRARRSQFAAVTRARARADEALDDLLGRRARLRLVGQERGSPAEPASVVRRRAPG